MSDIKIKYSSKLFRHIISKKVYLDIFTDDYCNDYLFNGNNVYSFIIHYLDRKHSIILFLFLVKLFNYEPDIIQLIRNYVYDMAITLRLGCGSKHCSNKYACFNRNYSIDDKCILDEHDYLISQICYHCRGISYSKNSSYKYNGYYINSIGGIETNSGCRGYEGCYCDYYNECYICELCELGVYCNKYYEAKHNKRIHRKERSYEKWKRNTNSKKNKINIKRK